MLGNDAWALMETYNLTATPSPCRGPSQGQKPLRSVRGPGVSSPMYFQAMAPQGLAGSWGAALPLCQLPEPLSLRHTDLHHGTKGLSLVSCGVQALPRQESSNGGGPATWLTLVTHPKGTQPLRSVRIPLCTCTPGQYRDSCRQFKPCFGLASTHSMPRVGAIILGKPVPPQMLLAVPSFHPPSPQFCPGLGSRRVCLAPEQDAGCRMRGAGYEVQGTRCRVRGTR